MKEVDEAAVKASSELKGLKLQLFGEKVKISPGDIQFSDKFSKGKFKNQVAERGWTNQSIAEVINEPFKKGTSINKYTKNSVTVYYVNDTHYVAVDDITKKVIQVSDRFDDEWVFNLEK